MHRYDRELPAADPLARLAPVRYAAPEPNVWPAQPARILRHARNSWSTAAPTVGQQHSVLLPAAQLLDELLVVAAALDYATTGIRFLEFRL